MVPSLSTTAKVFTTLLNRRAYGAAASKGSVWATSPDKGEYSAQNHDNKLEEKGSVNPEEYSGGQSSWAPDPSTGFYKPCDSGPEINAAELREMVFNHRRLKPQN